MSSSRYPDNSRYGRDRSPYRDRRPSTYGSAYPPRGSDSTGRPGGESSAFPPRDTPRGPKSLVDAPRGPISGPPSGAPSAPRDGRGRGFVGRSETPSLRDAPPLSSVHAPHNSWRADRDRDRDREFDRDRRERRPSPPRRSPIRDSRDTRDRGDFPPRDLDISRARRNSRDGPPSAGSTYSDPPPLSTGSSYRGSGIGRGRGGRDFSGDIRGRPRTFHNDDRDRHHDARDRIPDRSYRPRSRSRDPIRRERDPRDDRDFDRRDRDDRRFVPREYDSYIGPAAAAKSGPRPLDTHRPSISSDPRHAPGPPSGSGPHSSHHPLPADRLGPPSDSYSRRSSVATEPLSAKESRRDPGRDDPLLASRAEASRERYAPRASSPPAAVPAFGFSSNVWRNPALDTKTGTIAAQPPKPVQTTPMALAAPALASAAPPAPTPKPSIPSGLSTVPPTGPKADRVPERPHTEAPSQDTRPVPAPQRAEPPALPPPSTPSASTGNVVSDNAESKSAPPAPVSGPALQGPANSPPQGPAARPRPPPTGPQAAMRPNVSPSFSRPPHPPYAPRDASPGAIPPSLGPRGASGNALSANTSPKCLPANIPTGPKADRAPMAPRPPSMYPPADRQGFPTPRLPMGGPPKSMQWVRPGLNLSNRTTVPTKREFPAEDRDRSFGTAPKAPKFENSTSVADSQRSEQAKSESPSLSRPSIEMDRARVRAASAERSKASSPKPAPIETRRHSDVSMVDMPTQPEKPPVSAVSTASSADKVLDDSDDDLDLDEEDFAESEAKYNREKALLEAKLVDLSAPHLRATTPLQEIMLLASLTVDHIPNREVKSTDEEMVSIPSVQPPPESITTELPTPKADEPEDVIMEDKEEKEMAPATRALRLRRETSADQEMIPDLSALPYLGSGPPTPLSDIEQDRPTLPDSVMLSVRTKLRETIEPEFSTEETLQAYAAAYKAWRLHILPWEEARDQEDPERQPSVEPGIKVTTPDVSTAGMTALLDQPPTTTGRRNHSSRWASELDLEAVIKESLKTAEEERMGKKDSEPKRSMADPEKEAELPLELTEYEAQRRRFIDTNFQREPGQGIFVFHYEPPEDDFTEEEHKIMVHHYKDQYAKKWGKLAEILYKEAGTSRTYKDCINHYYATKWAREYKGKLRGRRGAPRKRGGGRGARAIANMERPEVSGEDGLPLALTETGRPRRSAAPTFGGTEPVDPEGSTPTPGGRARRPTDADSTQEKPGRRGKAVKERVGRKPKNAPLAATAAAAAAASIPALSPVKPDRKEKALGVKVEDDFSKRPLGEMPMPIQPGIVEEQVLLTADLQVHPVLGPTVIERPKTQTSSRPGPSSYWSVSELQDFQKNVAHFGTDWMAIANHMGTKTHTMVKNHYVRLVEGGTVPDLEQLARAADGKRERGEDLGPPPTPTPAPKRRYESTQAAIPRALAPTPEMRKSPVVNTVALPKASPPHSTQPPRFSTIAQAPVQAKPLVPGFPAGDANLTSVPSITPRQSPPTQAPPRSQAQHHHQHSFSQHKPHAAGPRAGYFSDDTPPRIESRQPAQTPTVNQTPRTIQQHAPPQIRAQDQQAQPPLYRAPSHQEQATAARPELQQEHNAQHRFQAGHSRHVSQEMPIHRPFSQGGPGSMMPSARSTSGAGSPDRGPIPHQHARHLSQAQSTGQTGPEITPQAHNAVSIAQQMPPRSTVGTPPVKEEPRPYSLPLTAQPQPLPSMQAPSSMHPQAVPQPNHNAPPPPVPKPAPEPRKSNLLSLLNDPEPEEQPRRKKPSDQGVLSHTPTPQQQTPIAPPPSVPIASRRDPYNDPATTQAPYSRGPFTQPTPASQGPSGRQVVDLTSEQARARENWQQAPQYHPSQSQAQQTAPPNAPHSGLAQPPPYGDSRMYGNHRAVFAQHNAPRHNPSPPPMAAYNNSPHLHSRTPSLSGPPGQPPRHGMSSATPSQHPQAIQGTSQILQPNPYAQVDPPGPGVQTPGTVGMRPSPHLHASHVVPQRDISSRNEHTTIANPNMAYSNPQTPNEHPVHAHMRGPSMAEQQYRRDLRDTRSEFDVRNTDRDTGRELSQRADAMIMRERERESLMARSTGPPPMHEDLRYQAQQQDRGYPPRSHTPLSRTEHGQHQPLQHPPHSSLGANSHPIYGQRPQEDRFREPYQRDNRMADRIREEQAHQRAAMSREEYLGREQRERNAQYQESLIRRDGNQALRGPPPPGPPPHGQDQRAPGTPMDWTRHHPQDRWQR